MAALPSVLNSQWDEPTFVTYREAFPEACRNDRIAFESHFLDLVERDVKAPYLKALQGYLWKHGYDVGTLKAPLFADVPPFIKAAHDAGKEIMIYSSGSVPAQKLFFGHTDAEPSDMSQFISEWFDTVNAGPKTEAASYTTIMMSRADTDPARWLFLSDNLGEVEAAQNAGMRSIPVTRPGNAPLPSDHPLTNAAIATFS